MGRPGRVAIGAFGVTAALALGTVLVRLEPGAGQETTPIDSGDVVHLHGVGRNPSDQRIYLATHAGLLRLGERGFELIADRYQDTMGFAVAGPDVFLASGHPDLREDRPSQLGLVRSRDRGTTWTSISLAGEADLHAIVVAHERIYAADSVSGRLLVSRDGGESWERRGSVALAALAVDPGDPDRLVGADPEGSILVSEDGGVEWRQADGPATVSLVWHPRLGLLGADARGVVAGRREDGSWSTVSELGGANPVIALDGDGVLAATDGGSVVQSDDAITWTQVTS